MLAKFCDNGVPKGIGTYMSSVLAEWTYRGIVVTRLPENEGCGLSGFFGARLGSTQVDRCFPWNRDVKNVWTGAQPFHMMFHGEGNPV